MIIGIDFGTCFSSIAIMNGLIPVTTFGSSTDARGIPTLFMFSKAFNTELYGTDCEIGEAVVNSKEVIRYMKKIVRQNPNNLNATVRSNGKDYTIKEVLKKYLAFLLAKAKDNARRTGEITNLDFERIAITAPVGIAEGQMTATDYNQLLVDTVVEITGIDKKKVNIIQEPVGAAMAYLYSDDLRRIYAKKQTIMVFDLGGGTLDVTILEHDPYLNQYSIKDKDGDLQLGGNDWDQVLAGLVMKKSGATGDILDPEEKSKFISKIVRLKEDLTPNAAGDIFFKKDQKNYFADVTRAEFELASKPLLENAVKVVKRVLGRYNGTIDKIVLVGGASNMPQVEARLKSEFANIVNGEENIFRFDPSKAISKGAAIYAKKIEDDLASGGTPIKPKDILSHTYGVDSHKDGVHMIYNILYKGESKPASALAKTSFMPREDSQTKAAFTVYESDAMRNGDDSDSNWVSLSAGNSNGIRVTVEVPQEYLGKATKFEITPELSIDENEILVINVRDKNGKIIGTEKKQL
ncbi:MAG: Hsp70 family protein [Clostridia bacterium]|nr:Hsp70 family protein [Clostridia bacterium]